MVWWGVLKRCGHRSTEEEVDCYVPASRYKEMEGRPCGPVSSDVFKLRCKAWATKDSASNFHWPAEVASRQSGPVEGLYKEAPDRWEGSRAATAGSGSSSLSLSRRAQQQDQAEYLVWMQGVFQLSPSACFREERRYRREGPLPVTPEKDVVEDSRRKREFARIYRSLQKNLPPMELAVWRLPQ